MLGIEFVIHHHGCLGTESTDRFPEVESQVLASAVGPEETASVLMSARAGPGELGDYLDYWRHRACVRRFELAAARGESAVFSVLMAPERRTVTQVVLDHGAHFATPIPIANGLETWNVLLPDERNKSSLFADLQEAGVLELRRLAPVDLAHALAPGLGSLDGLTGPQRRVLRFAFEAGYFETPRRAQSRELAEALGLAQSTFLEHLRKAQLAVLGSALRARPRTFRQ